MTKRVEGRKRPRRTTGTVEASRDYEHDAFISYRRSDGARQALWLRNRLQNYRLPAELNSPARQGLRCYIDTIFRRASDDFFEEEIVPNIRSSRFFILVATPNARKRRSDGKENWVEREVSAHLESDSGADRVFIALGKGSREDPLPGRLERKLANPDIADLTGITIVPGLRRPGSADPHDELLSIVATLYDIQTREMPILRQEDARQQNRRKARLATVASLVALISLGLTVWALLNLATARQRLAQTFAAQAESLFEQQPDRSRLFFARAVEASRPLFGFISLGGRSGEVARSWLGCWQHHPVPRVDFLPEPWSAVALAPSGDWVLSQSTEADLAGLNLALYYIPDGRLLPLGFQNWPPARPWPPVFSAKGNYLFFSRSLLRVSDKTFVDLPSVRKSGHNCSAFRPDERHLFVGTDRLDVFETQSGRLVISEEHSSPVMAAVYTDDGTRLIFLDQAGLVNVRAAASLSPIESASFSRPPTAESSFVIDPGGTLAAVAFEDGAIHVVNFRDGRERIERFASSGLVSVEFHPTQELLALVNEQGFGALWDLQSNEVRLLPTDLAIKRAKFSTDGVWMVTEHDDAFRVWDLETGKEAGLAISHAPEIVGVSFVGSDIVSAGGPTVRRRALAAHVPKFADLPEGWRLVSFDQTKDGLVLWNESSDDADLLRLLSTQSGESRVLDIYPEVDDDSAVVEMLAVCQGGDYLLLLDDHDEMRLLNVAERSLSQALPIRAATEWQFSAADPSCAHVVISTNNGLETWSLSDGERIGPPIETGLQFGLALSPNGNDLWIASKSTFEVFDIRSGSRRGVVKELQARGVRQTLIRFSPDGATAAVEVAAPPSLDAADSFLAFVDTRRLERSGNFIPLGRHANVDEALFTSDGAHIVVASKGELSVWNVSAAVSVGAVWDHLEPGAAYLVGGASDGRFAWQTGYPARAMIVSHAFASFSRDGLRLRAELSSVARIDPESGTVVPLSENDWRSRLSALESVRGARPQGH